MSRDRVTLVVALAGGCFLLAIPQDVLAIPQDAPAQEQGTVVATVVEASTGKPPVEALVFIEDGPRAEIGADGRVRMEEVPAGRRRIAAVATGCQIAAGWVDIPSGGVLSVRLEVVPPDDEEADGSQPTEAEPVSDRYGTPLKLITASELREMGAGSLLDVIRSVAPTMVRGAARYAGEVAGVGGRSRTSVLPGSDAPLVIVDGFRIQNDPQRTLAEIDPLSVVRIEIFEGAAGGWAHGLGGASGVIRVFTRTHAGIRPPRKPRECGSPF